MASQNQAPPVAERQPVLKWDGTIPAWGLFMLVFTIGMMWATYSWNRMQDLNDRLTMREVSAENYRKKVDQLEMQQRDVGQVVSGMRADIQVVKELMIRIEKQFERKQ